jgi:hypothetical protein
VAHRCTIAVIPVRSAEDSLRLVVRPSGVDPAGARRRSQNRRNVFEQLDAAIEGAAADHVQSNIGVAVVNQLPAAAAGDKR